MSLLQCQIFSMSLLLLKTEICKIYCFLFVQAIHQKIQSLGFKDCHAKIRHVDCQETVGNAVVIQVLKLVIKLKSVLQCCRQ